jgi:GrpB-like predicted nucleotidyltransferase (UPF0157 family)
MCRRQQEGDDVFAGDPVGIAPYDPNWPGLFAALAANIRGSLGCAALRIDHIGSTSVPGLAAKPVVDIQISVVDFEPIDAYRVPLDRLGYIYRPDNTDRTKRYFREPPGQRRTHIHVRRTGSFGEQVALLFRDFMRGHAAVAAQYAELKCALAQQYGTPEQRHAYTEAKGPFIWQAIAQADAWAQRTGWVPGPSDA